MGTRCPPISKVTKVSTQIESAADQGPREQLHPNTAKDPGQKRAPGTMRLPWQQEMCTVRSL